MGSIFSKNKTPRKKAGLITEQDKAVLQLKQQRDKVKQYQKKIKEQLEREREMARELIRSNNKKKALSLLKKKKYMDNVLEKADGQLENLEKMVMDIEFAQIETTVIEGLAAGNVALKQLHDALSIDKIESILDETREGIEKQKEIDELVSGSFSQEDEADLLRELEGMVNEETREELTEEEVTLPQVPQHEPEDMIEKVKNPSKDKEALVAS